MRTADPIIIIKPFDALPEFFSLQLSALIREVPAEGVFSMALSGGSTPGILFSQLVLHHREDIDWKKVLVFWGDERCVPPDSDQSNFRLAEKKLLDHVPVPGTNIFRINGEADPETEAERYEHLVRQHLSKKNDIPGFDLVMLGLGEDGHTASIFPENIHLFSSEKLFETSDNPSSGQKRITATGKLINHSKNIIFIVTGNSKAEIVSRILNKKEGWDLLPASLVNPVNGKLLWLLDEAAASKLDPDTLTGL